MSDLDAEIRRAGRLVAAVFDLAPEVFLAKRKGRPVCVQARQVLVYVLTMEGGLDQKAVADRIGRHHSTVWHAVQKIEALREDPELDRAIADLAEMYCRLRDAADRIPPALKEVPA